MLEFIQNQNMPHSKMNHFTHCNNKHPHGPIWLSSIVLWWTCGHLILLSYLYFPINYQTSDTEDWYYRGGAQNTQKVINDYNLSLLLFLNVEKYLQPQKSHPGTMSRPNPCSGHPEKRPQDCILATLLDQGYHQGVGAGVQEEGCCTLLVIDSHSSYKKGEEVLIGGEHG